MNFNETEIKTAAEGNDVDLVVLYGSQLSGQTHAGSDIDIAVRSKTPKIDHDRFNNILSAFVEIMGEKLDLVILNAAPPLLKYQIALYGKALYENRRGIFDDFKVRAAHDYADTKKFRELNTVFVEGFLKGVIPVGR